MPRAKCLSLVIHLLTAVPQALYLACIEKIGTRSAVSGSLLFQLQPRLQTLFTGTVRRGCTYIVK